jgi:capsular polysaccharide biosynthesis protein
MQQEPITIATLAQFIEGQTGATAASAHVENLLEAGAYLRRRPFRMDVAALDAGQRPVFEQYYREDVAHFGPIRHMAFRDAVVAGQGAVVTRDFRLVYQSAAEFLVNGAAPDGLSEIGENRFVLAAPPTRTIERPTLLLKRPWNGNYGHWLVDSAALLALASGLAMPSGWQIAIARQQSPELRRVVRETLDIVAPGIEVVEHPDDETWRYADLHYVSPIHDPTAFKVPSALAALRALVLRGDLATGQGWCRLYITRGDHPARRLRNEEAVIALCRELGFEVVAPEQLSLVEQARLFRQADLVVGVKGAALTNALFCSSRAHVVALSPGDFPDSFFWDLLAQSGIAYSEIFGVLQTRDQAQGHNEFSIDINGLRTILGACLEDIGARPL